MADLRKQINQHAAETESKLIELEKIIGGSLTQEDKLYTNASIKSGNSSETFSPSIRSFGGQKSCKSDKFPKVKAITKNKTTKSHN